MATKVHVVPEEEVSVADTDRTRDTHQFARILRTAIAHAVAAPEALGYTTPAEWKQQQVQTKDHEVPNSRLRSL